jgi:nucleotide-binding universal stress UspA family protein
MMIALKRVLVATDFGEAAEVALNYGRELARTFGATLEVLHVCDNAVAHGLGGDGLVGDYSPVQHEMENAARTELDALLTDEDRAVLRAKAVLVSSSKPAQAIVDYAKASCADLVVVGTHGRGSMAQLVMGSVAERVVRLASCPVLTLRHPEREFVLPDALVAVARA